MDQQQRAVNNVHEAVAGERQRENASSKSPNNTATTDHQTGRATEDRGQVGVLAMERQTDFQTTNVLQQSR